MKKITLLLVAAAPFLATAQTGKPSATIAGSFKNIKDTVDRVYLYYMANGQRVTDSANVTDGKYTFTAPIAEATQATLRAKNTKAVGRPAMQKDYATVFIEPGNIAISNVDSFSNIKVKGSKSHVEFEKLQAQLKPYEDQTKPFYTKYAEARKAKDQEGAKKAEATIDSIEAKMQETVYGGYIKANSSSPIALYALQQYAGYQIDADKIEPIFNQLPAAQQNSAAGTAFKSKLETAKKVGVGRIAPDFTQNDTLGQPITLSSLRGKYVLVDFWASWCGPCRMENPNVVKAYNAYKDKGFNILSVSLDQPGAKERWMKAIHDDKLTWTHVSDLQYWNNAVAKEYGVQAIPQNFLLDPNGKIIARDLRGETLEEKLKSVLGANN